MQTFISLGLINMYELNWKAVLNIVQVFLNAIWTFRSIQIVRVQRKLMSSLCTVIKVCALLNVLP
jgi:hypothetical protein